MNRSEHAALRAVLKQHGIQQTYRAAGGETVHAALEGMIATLAALGVDTSGSILDIARREEQRAAGRIVEPVIVAWNGRIRDVIEQLPESATHAELRLENGDVAPFDPRVHQQPLPFGYHQLRIATREHAADALVIAAPRRCYDRDAARGWGVFAPLYALRGHRDQPIGDIADLTGLMHWIGELGGDVVGTLPISAAFLRTPFEPSPYAPASRLAWNELYLHIEGARLPAPDDSGLVDYARTARFKRGLLEADAARFFEAEQHSDEFDGFLKAYPYARDYAAFRAAGERFNSGWPVWPEPARNGDIAPPDYDESAFRYHLYAQFSAHRQLTALADETRRSGVKLYLDMPLGVHPDSYDTWRNRDLFVTGAAAGAPPDPFFNKGQNWGFPPMHPQHMREQGYAYWRAVLQTQLRYAGVLRLDHVMGLHRLYFVPQGFEATQGVYVRYPHEELYAVLALESQRHRATIVGEDLGTVPAEIRHAMDAHAVRRMFVVQFEATDDQTQPLAGVAAHSFASLNTHDMPPFRAYWEARDADLRKELGLIDDAGVAAARASRARTAAALSRMLHARGTLDTRAARDALLQFLARSTADIVLVNLEDLWLETEAQNVPGTTSERPNWRRRLKFTLAELRSQPEVNAVLSVIEHARH